MAGERHSSSWATRIAGSLHASGRTFLLLALASAITLSGSALSTSATPATSSHAFPGGEKPSAYGSATPAQPAPPALPPLRPAPAPLRPEPAPAPIHRAPVQSRIAPTPTRPSTTQYPARSSYPTPQAMQESRETAQAAPPQRPALEYALPPAQSSSRSSYGRFGPVQYRPGAGNRPGEQPNGGEHLPAWLRKHQNESPAEQERSLRQEPGFNRLSPQQQQERINTLHRLNDMPPDKRELTLMRMENFERLSPQMREAVRSSVRQMGDLPQDRKRLVQKAFRDLSAMPPEQRGTVMNSPQFAGQFSAQERSIMSNLLTVEPYRNPGPPPDQLQYGKQ